MKKISSSKNERFVKIDKSQMSKIVGGDNGQCWQPTGNGCNSACCCSCQYADNGGSSIDNNMNANEAGGLVSEDAALY